MYRLLKVSVVALGLIIVIGLSIYSVNVVDSSYKVPQDENALGTIIQDENGFTSFHSGRVSLQLVSLVNTTGSIAPGIEILNNGTGAVRPFSLDITSLSFSDNFSNNMSIAIYNESNGKLDNLTSASYGFLAPTQSIAPVQKMVGGYTEGDLSIASGGGIFLNGTLSHYANYLASQNIIDPYGNVTSSYPLNISIRGLFSSTLNLLSSSEWSYFRIYFSPGNWEAPLIFGNNEYNPAGKIVVISQFSSVTVGLQLGNAKFALPYNLISSLKIDPFSSSYAFYNGTYEQGIISTLNGQVYNVSGNYSIKSQTPILVTLSPTLNTNGLKIKYTISTDFGQVFTGGSPLLTISLYHYSESVRVMSGISAGAAISAMVGLFIESLRSAPKKVRKNGLKST
ncbi:MAG: hypothetical protein M0Z77_08150 [Thermoplasmatales archaeon]|jgi:hypothetical protein|nr:hypothetical protein [Thermoplasmatales archaeon]